MVRLSLLLGHLMLLLMITRHARSPQQTAHTPQVAALRMRRLCLLVQPGGQKGADEAERLVLEAQASEAAMRAVLSDARAQQLKACQALAAELRRVAALEQRRAADSSELAQHRQRAAAAAGGGA